MKLQGVMLGSDNPDVLVKFYTDVFGTPGWHQDNWYGFEIGGGNVMIGPHSEVHGKNNMPGRLIISFTTENLKEDFARIKGLGAEVVAEPYQPSAEDNPDLWLATFADPDGNYLQLSPPW